MESKYYKPHTFIKEEAFRNEIEEYGYKVIGNIGKDTLGKLLDLHQSLHSIKTSEGAMFYSIYSQDLEYRKKVHESISAIVAPILDSYFEEYKNVINSFIIKSPGNKSEFALHQDSSILDESKYSQLSLWIPLQDTNLQNGTLCVVPKTHKIFLPYRGVSIKPPYQNYESLIRAYLLPINLNAGDILAFDYRLVHYSPANLSKNDRVVVMCGIFDKHAKFEVAYQENENSPIEIFQQDDDYLLSNLDFHLACDCRPETGKKIKEESMNMNLMSEDKFIAFARENKLENTSIENLLKLELNSYTVIDANYKASIKEIIKDKVEKVFK